MKRPALEFLHRGMLFGGFGPIVLGVVYFFLGQGLRSFSLSGGEVLLGILSTYLLAFVHAGSSIFPQLEHWSIPRAAFTQGSILYLAYTAVYLLNDWIPFSPAFLLIYTAAFLLAFLAIWIGVFLTTRRMARKLNEHLKNGSGQKDG